MLDCINTIQSMTRDVDYANKNNKPVISTAEKAKIRKYKLNYDYPSNITKRYNN